MFGWILCRIETLKTLPMKNPSVWPRKHTREHPWENPLLPFSCFASNVDMAELEDVREAELRSSWRRMGCFDMPERLIIPRLGLGHVESIRTGQVEALRTFPVGAFRD